MSSIRYENCNILQNVIYELSLGCMLTLRGAFFGNHLHFKGWFFFKCGHFCLSRCHLTSCWLFMHATNGLYYVTSEATYSFVHHESICVEVGVALLLNLAPEQVKWSALCPGCLIPRARAPIYPLYRRLVDTHSQFGHFLSREQSLIPASK